MSETPHQPVTAMVSYAWGGEEHHAHREKVKGLVDQLRGDGIDVIFDRYRLRDGDDVDQFMEQVAAAGNVQKVMAICEPRYVAKMNARQDGVGKEGMIMSQHVYEQLRDTGGDEQRRRRRFIAVIFERDPERPFDGPGHLPTMFGAMKHIDMSTPNAYDRNYDQLLRFLLDRPEEVEPAVGKVPAHLLADTTATVPAVAEAHTVRRLTEQERPAARAWADYLAAVEAALRAVPPAAEGTLEGRDSRFVIQRVVDEVTAFHPVRDEFVQLITLAVRYDVVPVEELLEFFQRVLRLSDRLAKAHQVNSTVWNLVVFTHADVLVMELYLYAATLLTQQRRGSTLKALTEHVFFLERHGQLRPAGFTELQHLPEQRAFEDQYKTLTGQNWTSPLGAFLKANATLQSTPWLDLATTDLLLFLKSALDREEQGTSALWSPVFGPYFERIGQLPFFQRWTSRKQIAPWLEFFGAASPDELKARLHAALPNDTFRHIIQDGWREIPMAQLLAMDDWAKLP